MTLGKGGVNAYSPLSCLLPRSDNSSDIFWRCPMSLQIQSKRPIRILLQTTIPATPNDWDIGRFSLLAEHLTLLKDQSGRPLCDVTARNREADASGDEPILSGLDRSDFDE